MKSTLTLVLVAAASVARADVFLDAAAGSVFVTSTDGLRTVDYVRTPGGPWLGVEVVAQSANAQPVIEVSHSVAGLAVHSGAGGSALLTTSFFCSGGAVAPNPPYVLQDPRTALSTAPVSVRTIALDPGEPSDSTVLLDASHVLLPRTNQHRALALVQRASGEAVLVDYDLGSGPVRRTPLGFTAPIGSNKGGFVGAPDGTVWASFASADGIRLFDLGDLSAPGTLHPTQVGALAVGGGFDPRSAHLGIIAILIGLITQPVPSLSYQVGEELFVSAFDGTAFRPLARQAVPPEASSNYQNMLGATFEARGIVASFPLSVLSEANEVRIVYDGKGCADWKNKLSEECAIGFKLKDVK